MSRSEHQRAVDLALASSETLRGLFDALGTRDNPERGIWAAYGLAAQALPNRLNDLAAVRRTLKQLRATVRGLAEKDLTRAIVVGEKHSRAALVVYGLAANGEYDPAPLVDSALLVVDATLDHQMTQIEALVMNDMADAGLVVGDGIRPGILRASDVTRDIGYWLTAGAMAAWLAVFQSALGRPDEASQWRKQAVAAIDERTTDCCLRVSGQAQPVDGLFHLTGRPRYADYLPNSPFHDWCRTATALVRADDAGDDVTQAMRMAAKTELDARETTGTRQEIHPANARTTRSGGEF